MKLTVSWSPRAASRFEEAALYFESVRQGSGVGFVDDVAKTLDRASEHPMANPGIPGESAATRKAVVPRFDYWVIYEVRAEKIIVLTIWSATRTPGSWHEDVNDQDRSP